MMHQNIFRHDYRCNLPNKVIVNHETKEIDDIIKYKPESFEQKYLKYKAKYLNLTKNN
jgi:hypothetical protein